MRNFKQFNKLGFTGGNPKGDVKRSATFNDDDVTVVSWFHTVYSMEVQRGGKVQVQVVRK